MSHAFGPREAFLGAAEASTADHLHFLLLSSRFDRLLWYRWDMCVYIYIYVCVCVWFIYGLYIYIYGLYIYIYVVYIWFICGLYAINGREVSSGKGFHNYGNYGKSPSCSWKNSLFRLGHFQ